MNKGVYSVTEMKLDGLSNVMYNMTLLKRKTENTDFG